MDDNIFNIALLFSLFFALYLYFQYNYENAQNLKKGNTRTIAKIISVERKRVKIEYSIDGKLYEKYEPKIYNIYTEGEEYKLAYDRLNHYNVLILRTEPIMPSNVDTTYSKKVEPSDKTYITFYFKVNGREYKKSRIFPKSIEQELGDEYMVLYQRDNLENAFILLDKPKK